MLSFPGAEGTVAVHLAPSAHSPRAADGKAAVALDEPFYYYGAEDGWLMIRYSVNGGRVWRIGYIDLAALPQTEGKRRCCPLSAGRARACGWKRMRR